MGVLQSGLSMSFLEQLNEIFEKRGSQNSGRWPGSSRQVCMDANGLVALFSNHVARLTPAQGLHHHPGLQRREVPGRLFALGACSELAES